MKNRKLAALSNTPAGAVIAVGLIVVVVELLIMMVVEDVFPLSMHKFLYLFDPILLIAITSPALYFLMFRPMYRQQAELENARKKIGQAFQEWIAALDVIDDPIFLHDQDFRILRCNKAYQRCAGIPFHEIIGQPYYEVFPKNHEPLPSCRRAMEKAEEEEEEEVTTGGAIYRSRAFSIHDEQGAYLYSVHTLEDITGRKQAEAAFRTLIGTAATNIGAVFFHETVSGLSTWLGVECVIVGEIVDENRVQALAMQLDGKAIEHYEYALPGTPCDNVAHKGYCEYPEGVCQLFPSDKDLSDMGAEAYAGMPIRDKNGKAIGVLCVISRHKLVLPPMTKGVFEIIAARAGTEIVRRHAEEELRLRARLLDSALDSIFMHDFDGNFVYMNEAAWKTRGYTRDELMGMNLHVLDTPEYEKLIEPRIRELLEKGHNLFEAAHRRKDGSVMPVEISARIIESGGRKLILTTVRDITERKRAEAHLTEQLEELRGWHDVTLGRELRVLELKHEVDELLAQAGQPPRYPNVESEG